ncbi:MAG: PaaI family thioesterase [Polyangiaceae bacterium]|nr:PaaI family thioesterase [Polyangiaceae bacterium]MCW5788949.1 PaaI family thioesterase [Polyangiaceae bacterium]
MKAPEITPEAFTELVNQTMHVGADFRFRVLELEWGRARVHLEGSETFQRPGGTISGPTLFTLADLTLWAAVLSCIGFEPLAVTSDLTLHFLRRPPLGALEAEARILKCGRRLVHGDVRIASPGRDEAPVCHASGTYARS